MMHGDCTDHSEDMERTTGNRRHGAPMDQTKRLRIHVDDYSTANGLFPLRKA
ncbi:hypothetical protein T06_14558 [Trichinella sp. T6]|nr:hypothetical protein T06_14558 [Trichinella sp. T6]